MSDSEGERDHDKKSSKKDKQRKFMNDKKKRPAAQNRNNNFFNKGKSGSNRGNKTSDDLVTSSGLKVQTTVDGLDFYFKNAVSISHIPIKRVLASPTTFRGPIFNLLFHYSKVSQIMGAIKTAQICTLTQAYRATLVQIYGKMLSAQLSSRQITEHRVSAQSCLDGPLALRDAAYSSMTNFALVAQSVNSLGLFEVNGTQYVPISYETWGKPERSMEVDESVKTKEPAAKKRKRNVELDDTTYPRATEVNILNLDFVLDQLTIAESPAAWRKHIRDFCAIPGLVWIANNIVTEASAEQVLPIDYLKKPMSMLRDLQCLDALLTKISVKYSYLKGCIARTPSGNDSQLVYCDEVEGSRIIGVDYSSEAQPRDSRCLAVIDVKNDLVGFLNFMSESGPDKAYDSRRNESAMTHVVQTWETEVLRITNLPA